MELNQAAYAFSPFAIPTAITSLLMLVFAGSVLRRQVSRVAIAFSGVAVAIFVWLVAFSIMYSTRHAYIALMWARAAYWGVPLIAPAIYQFSVETLHLYSKRRAPVLAGWVSGALFALIAARSDVLVTHVQHFAWGFYPRFRPLAAVPFLIFFAGYLIGAMLELIVAWPASRGVERKRIVMLMVAYGVAYFGCVDYLPTFGVAVYPFGYLAIIAFVFICHSTFRRYDLAAITPSLAAPEIIRTMADALFVCDAEGRIRFANRAAETLLGYGPRELDGLSIETLVDADDGDISYMDLRTEAVRTKERVFVAKNGDLVDLMLSIAPVLQHGEPAGAVLIGRDIRERKESEQQVREAVTLLESTLDSTADGILVIGDNGKILSFNERFVEMWRVPRKLMESGDAKRAIHSVLDQLARPDEFVQTIKSLEAQPEAESFDLIEFKDGRRFERYSNGRHVAGVANIRVWSFRDVTERFRAEEAMRESELRYRTLFERNAAGVCVASADGEIEECNDTFASMLGYERAELIGGRLNEIYWRPSDRTHLENMLRDTQTLNSVEVELRRKDGTRLWVVKNLTFAGDRIHMTVVDISSRKRAEEQIEFHAYHDVLTQLPNRKLFMDRLTQNITHARRSGKSLAVMFIDLDNFKIVNDTLGHTAGDEVLLEMSKRLMGCIRAEDTVARLGGDEFSIVLSELRRPEDAGRVAEKIISAVQRPMPIGNIPMEVSASIGIAIYPVDGMDPESLLRNADSAMYRAKEAGRNTYQLCTDDMKKRAIERLSLESRLRKAVVEEQFVLHYQPQVSLDRSTIIGIEALVRWDDPEHGLVYPSSFIPLAEESRMILPIGDWVLRTACEQMRRWREEGLRIPHIAVNLSARQFQQHDLVDRVGRVLHETGLDGASLEIEVTETTAMANAEATIDVLNGLRELGVSISIDDFGTGYSSLNYLKRFPITTVKIDRAFVRDLATSEGDAAIVSAVIGIARSLRLRVIAEGVETEEQLAFLKQKGCDGAQGYFFSRPIPGEAVSQLLAERKPLRRAKPRLIV